MKKLFITFFLLFLCLLSIFAYQNTYNCESEEYILLEQLCRLSGITHQNLISPIPVNYMVDILNRIDTDKLPEAAKRDYVNLKNKLDNPLYNYKAGESFLFNGYANLSYQWIKQSEKEYDWALSKKDRKPFVTIGSDFHFNDYVFANITADLTDIDNGYISANKYEVFTDNTIKDIVKVDWSTPHKAFVSLGYDKMNLIVGRDKVSLGSGKTGNLILGNTLWYNDFIKASVLSNPVAYDFTILSFVNSEGTNVNEHLQHPLRMTTNPLYKELHQLVFVHNISFMPKKWLSVSLTEGALVFGDSVAMDLRKLNPFMVLHNIFDYMYDENKGNMNNFCGLEVSLALPEQWSIDVQFMLDQLQFPAEMELDKVSQSAFACLVNAEKTTIIFDNIGSYYVELAYLSPNMYLKEDDVGCGQYWNLDLIVGNDLVWSESNEDEVSYLGYKYGPDTVVLGAGAKWKTNKGLKCDLNSIFKVHGNHGVLFYEGQKDTCINYGSDNKLTFLTGNLEKRLMIDFKTSYSFNDFISLDGQLNYFYAWNYLNSSGNNHDLQASLSVSLDALKSIKNISGLLK